MVLDDEPNPDGFTPGLRYVRSLARYSFTLQLLILSRPTAAYSYSFAPNYTHTGIYSSGLDFCKYLDSVTKRFDLESKIQLNTDVTRLHYDEKADEWEVLLLHLAAGAGDLSSKDRQQRLDTHGADSVILGQETLRAKIVISCVGFLVEPKLWPKTIPGRETFRGEVIHSARWRQEVDFEHKDVVVIGTGCSASQIVPAILDEPFHVKSVTQVMRTPPWLGPSIAEPFGKETYARVAPVIFRYAPWLGFFFRVSLFMLVETIWVSAFQRGNVKSRARFEKDSLNRVRSAIPQKYHAMMTPEYPYGSKRRLFDIAWLGSMNKPNYHLTTKVLKSVGPFTVTLGSSRASPNQPIERTESEDDVEVHADVIVLANGYDASLWIQPLDVYGRGGKSIHEFWNERGGPQAYMGTAVDGFPNFFMVEGPNTITGHWSMILVTENMVGYIIKIIKPVLQGNARFVEPKKQATLEWADRIQRDLQRTVFVDSKSWYQDESGFNSMMYP